MNITWGNKLLLVFIAFAGLMAFMVYKSMNQHFELVSADYYKDELRYQDKIDGANNADKISQLQIRVSENAVTIQLPNELKGFVTTGDILFYCASQSSSDRKFILVVNENGEMTIDNSKLEPVNYLVKTNWQTGGITYNNQQKIRVER